MEDKDDFNIRVQIEILKVTSGAYDHPNLHMNVDDYCRGFDPRKLSGKVDPTSTEEKK